MNILIVDDWEDIGVLLRRNIVKHLHHVKVEQVLDIPDAPQAIERLQPHIVVLDVRLPSGSGLGLIQFVKRLLPEAKVIMFTGYADLRTERSAMDLGADYFFYKSDDYEKFVETVTELIPAPHEV